MASEIYYSKPVLSRSITLMSIDTTQAAARKARMEQLNSDCVGLEWSRANTEWSVIHGLGITLEFHGRRYRNWDIGKVV